MKNLVAILVIFIFTIMIFQILMLCQYNKRIFNFYTGTKRRFSEYDIELYETNDQHTNSINDRVDAIPNVCKLFTPNEIIGPCKPVISWRKRMKYMEMLRTKLSASIVNVTINYSTTYHVFVGKVFIETFDRRHQKKGIGGDSWRVLISSNETRVDVNMKDLLDGCYIGWFIMEYSGNYSVNIALEYSLCEGLTDPPMDWFTKGTVQGKFQAEGILGPIDQFLNEQLLNITINLHRSNFEKNNPYNVTVAPLLVNSNSCIINTACGYWRNGFYQGYQIHNNKKTLITKYLERKPKGVLSTLLIFGDSQGRRLYKSVKNHPLCENLFERCDHTYTWTYKHFSSDSYQDRFKYTKDDFNESKFLTDIQFDLQKEDMKSSKSVYLINFGVHIIMTLQLERGFKLFRMFLQMLNRLKEEKEADEWPHIIWKSTTLPVIENSNNWNITHSRFLTKQRVNVWNSYTLEHARKANVTILDIHQLPLATPHKAIDHVHYPFRVFRKAEDELLSYLIKTYNL